MYIYIHRFYLLISCAFSGLIDIIEEVLLASTEFIPVFMMKDLRLNYQRILKKLGATDKIKRQNTCRISTTLGRKEWKVYSFDNI